VLGGAAACTGSKSPWRFFTVDEARTLAAVCDTIIPPDADHPGAEWASVVNYIDIQLGGPFQYLQENYRAGLASLEGTSQKQFGKAFAALEDTQQTQLLAALEKNDAPKELWTTVGPGEFFEMVLPHTMQGYYGDPRHGGNRERSSWKMLGLPYPPVRGRFRNES
jgi:gluconate 2-dehydrogenase gamma chain